MKRPPKRPPRPETNRQIGRSGARSGRGRTATMCATAAACAVAVASAPIATAEPSPGEHSGGQRHVLLLSVDGLHQQDLTRYAHAHPRSALARLLAGGTEYSNASTPIPSDSFPGLIAQATGGNPASTGIYYDDTYNHDVYPAGTTSCVGPRGGEVAFTEAADRDPLSIDAGQGLAGLPASIASMTANPATLLDPAQLPVNAQTCKPIYPHSYVKVNTIFEVAHQAGLHTAWSDKHPAYEILNGPSGEGVDDLFTPEINSSAPGYAAGGDWTTDNAATRQYDGYKVQAVLNEIDGYDHSRSYRTGVPALFGMNFQSVSTAEKLPTSDGLAGGYLPGGDVPGPLLSKSLEFVDASLTRMIAEIANRGLAADTTIVVSAKHAQSPTNPAALTRIPDSPIIAAINAAWHARHPETGDLVVFATDDDIMQLWLSDRAESASAFVADYLRSHEATGNTISGRRRTLPASGLSAIYAGAAAAAFYRVAPAEPNHPDVVGIVSHGVVYTGKKAKIAEHGGADPQDRNVPILVAGATVGHGRTISRSVETTQIAPTVLELLGLDPHALQAVAREGTRVLPGL